MANVKFSRKEFEKNIKITKEIEEKIPLFGTPLESLNNDEIEIEIFPNRPDLYSLQGYLRSFLAFLGKKTGLKEYKLEKPEKDFQVTIDKSVRDIRPFTACAIVKNLKFDNEKIKEIIDIQEKLHSTIGRNRKKIAIGIYPLEAISLPIKYEARKPKDIKFQPLESNKEMTGEQILRQHPTGKEYAHLLKGKDKFPVFVDAKNEILSMPPVINSNKTGKITENTKDVFIECSGFDFNLLKKILNILVTTLSEMEGKIYQMNLKYKRQEITPDLSPEKIRISIEDMNKLLGLNLEKKQVKKLLEKMGYNFSAGDSEVQIPGWRTDILHPVDIYEDLAISYGYDNFEAELPEISTIGQESEIEVKKRRVSEILAGLGLIEIKTHHLLTKEDLKKSGLRAEIEVEESKTDYKFLRSSLMPSIFKILSENLDSEYPQKIFELGTCFKKDEKESTGIKEFQHLSIALTPSNFTELKQILEYLARMLEIELKIEETENEKFIEGRIGKIMFKGREIGVIGEIHPSLLNSLHLKMPVSYLEVDLSDLF